MKYEQIKNRTLTELDRQRLNTTFKELKKGCTKMQLAMTLGLKGTYSTVEKLSRDYISMVAKDYPVLSVSSSTGYCMALNFDVDYEKAVHTANEINSRVKEMLERLVPIKRFIELKEKGATGMVDFKEWGEWVKQRHQKEESKEIE